MTGNAAEGLGPARLTLLCHASTEAVRTAAFPLDEPLDPQGRAATAALAGKLPAVRTVFSSPARRAVETATAAGLSPQIETALSDCDYGRWAGATLSDIAAAEPDAVALWLSDLDAAPHGGEPISALLRRVADWMDSAAVEGRVLAVTHASVIRAAAVHAVGAPAQSFWRIDAAPLASIELRRNERRWSLHAS
jgi:broad specificity phosphatase PhoE